MNPDTLALRIALVGALAVSLSPETADAQTLAIRNATVIDGSGGPPRQGADVCIAGGRIASIGARCTAEPGARVVDATGMYLTPGFVDMHVHVLEHGRDENGDIPPDIDWNDVRRRLQLLLEHGVTTIRDPGSETEAAVALRQRLERGDLTGPRLFTAGRILNASSFSPEPFRPVRTAQDVRREIQRQKAAGVDFIKVYSSMPPDLVRAAVEEAHASGLPVIGHLQRTTWTDAARLGIDHLAHGAPWTADLLPDARRAGYAQTLFGRVYWLDNLDLAAAPVDTLTRELVERGVFVDPTLIASHTKFFGNQPRWLRNPDNGLLPGTVIAGWTAGSFTRDWTAEQYDAAQRAWPRMLALTKLLFDCGVTLTVGTDAPTAWIVPGAGFHDELVLLRDADIPPAAIIRMATLNGARALRRDAEFGTIAPGRYADLVLLTRDPLAAIENTRSIAAVLQGGQVKCASVPLRGMSTRSVGPCRRKN